MLEKPSRGAVLYKNQNIHKAKRNQKQRIREKIQLVLQDPYLSLPAWMKVGDIIADPLLIHEKRSTSKSAKYEKIVALLKEVGLSKDAYNRYPLSFSAGQRQMINIVRAIVLEPELVILDEAVSALDVSVQANILNLFSNLRERHNLTYMLIAHDIGVVRHMCDRIGVMYLGEFVELGDNESIFKNPLHPYTNALLNAVPTIEKGLNNERIEILSGEVPSPINIPEGCTFASRCPKVMPICGEREPQMIEHSEGHFVHCHLYSR
jgi:peptide/nickel transport system ATP-binding protein/oligopeptide transport system ATP-binding protein